MPYGVDYHARPKSSIPAQHTCLEYPKLLNLPRQPPKQGPFATPLCVLVFHRAAARDSEGDMVSIPPPAFTSHDLDTKTALAYF